MMGTQEDRISVLKVWFGQTESWLHADGSPVTLQRHHKQLLDLMVTARNDNHSSRVWELIEEMEKLTLRMTDIREQGEVFIGCAKMATDLENLKDSLRLCQAAESKYKSYPHQRAVVLWMTGCIHWLTHQVVDAISSWQETISLFRERKLSVQVDIAKAKWYMDMVPRLEQYLEQAIKMDGLPPFTEPIDFAAETKEASQKENENLDFLRWLSCTVSDSVPAGGFGSTGFDPDPIGCLEIKEVIIAGEIHTVHNTRKSSSNGNSINIGLLPEYKVVHVKGTSMNAARPTPITDGDYILVHLQKKPVDNDIVVASISGIDTLATVKRFRRRNNKVQLIPESTDGTHYEIDWEKELDGNELNIVGIVEAVF